MSAFKGYAMILGAAFFWGASATLAKSLLNQELDTLLLVQTRVSFSLVMLALGLVLFAPAFLRVSVRDVWRFALLGVIGLAGSNFTYYVTMKESNVATAITIQYAAPLFVMAYEVFKGEERFTTTKLSAALLALAGCLLTVSRLDFTVLHISRLGVLTGIGSIFAFAFLTVFTRHMLARYNAWTVTFYSIFFSSVFWLAVNPPWKIPVQTLPTATWGVLFVLAMVSVLVPNLLYVGGLQFLVPSRAIITSTFEPVVAIATAAMFVGESLTLAQSAGALMVIAAIIVLQRQPESAESPPLNRTPDAAQ